MTDALVHVAGRFFAATCSLAGHTGSLQERLADAYADHLLQVTSADLPEDYRAAFGELERVMSGAEADDEDDDPFQAATRAMPDAEARALIERIVLLYGQLARAASA